MVKILFFILVNLKFNQSGLGEIYHIVPFLHFHYFSIKGSSLRKKKLFKRKKHCHNFMSLL